MRGCGGRCGSVRGCSERRPGHRAAPALLPSAAPRGKDRETGLSSHLMSATNLSLIASLKNKTSAVLPPSPTRAYGILPFPAREKTSLRCSFTRPAPRSPTHNPRVTVTPGSPRCWLSPRPLPIPRLPAHPGPRSGHGRVRRGRATAGAKRLGFRASGFRVLTSTSVGEK